MSTPGSDAAAVLRRQRYMVRQRGDAAVRQFLESTPPNVGIKIENLFSDYHPGAQNKTWSVRPIPIELFCETCGGPRFFETKTDYLFARGGRDWSFVHYTCKNCE